MVSSIQGMGAMRPMGGMQAPQPLSSEEKETVKDLLSEYDPESMTADDAKSLFKSLQEAGIKGAGLREAIKEAGFDPEKVWSLGHDGQTPPQGGPGGMGGEGSTKINSTTLKTLQSILDQFDLTNLSSDQEDDLVSKLSSAGLMKTGSVIDLKA
jgi:hypothetical protein